MDARQKSFYLAQRRRYERYVWALEPVFWLPLREQTGSIARNRMYRGGVGPELITNPGVIAGVGSPFTFTADNPDSWIVTGETGPNVEVTEVAAGEGHAASPTPGGGHVCLYTLTGDLLMLTQNVVTPGDTYRSVIDIDTMTAPGIIRTGSSPINIGPVLDSAGVFSYDFIAQNAGIGIKRSSTPTDVTLSGHSVRKIGEVDALIAGTTSLGQPGQMGVSEAFLLDGATSLLTITNRASLQGRDEFSLWALFRPVNAGEGDAGVFFAKADEFELRFNSASRDLYAAVHYDTTDAEAITSTTLAANEWHSVGLRIDDSSKQIDLFIDGVEASYTSRTAGVGNRASSANNLIVGNNSAVTGTLSGLLDEAMMLGRALNDSEWRRLHRLAGLD